MFLKSLLDYSSVQLCNARSKFSVSISMPVEMNVCITNNNAMALALKKQPFVEIDAAVMIIMGAAGIKSKTLGIIHSFLLTVQHWGSK